MWCVSIWKVNLGCKTSWELGYEIGYKEVGCEASVRIVVRFVVKRVTNLEIVESLPYLLQ